jgi:hypothetical protein
MLGLGVLEEMAFLFGVGAVVLEDSGMLVGILCISATYLVTGSLTSLSCHM